jgi:ABC-type bacteriocin/lantibiotic exporter with double-glycine peptidase domain
VKNKHILKIKFLEQTRTSGNCGPCSIKMLLDHHHIKNPMGLPFSVQSLNKLVKVSKKWGCEEESIEAFLKRFKISYKKIPFSQLHEALKAKKPVLALYQDELHDGHYGLIVGYDSDHFIFHDPWPDFGANFKRQKKTFAKQAKVFNNWLVILN